MNFNKIIHVTLSTLQHAKGYVQGENIYIGIPKIS